MVIAKAWIGVAAAAAVVVIPVVLLTVGTMQVAGATGSGVLTVATAGDRLRPDAPIPGQYLAWVIRGGAVCDAYGPAWLAAELDAASHWNPAAVDPAPPLLPLHSGLAGLSDAQWAMWGGDHDADGVASPPDPEDAIMTMASAMCDLLKWSQQQIDAKRLRGDVFDIALAAYWCGQDCVLGAGGVPAVGPGHDFPATVRELLPQYGAAGNIIAVATAELTANDRNREMAGDCNFYTGQVRPWMRGGCVVGSFGASPWCADFAHWVWQTSGGIDTDGIDGWAQSFRAYGEHHVTWHLRSGGYIPRAGDAIVYDWDGKKTDDHPIDHVGLVVEVRGGWVYTIEGNVGGEGKGHVDRRSHPLTDTDIIGYTTPVPG